MHVKYCNSFLLQIKVLTPIGDNSEKFSFHDIKNIINSVKKVELNIEYVRSILFNSASKLRCRVAYSMQNKI